MKKLSIGKFEISQLHGGNFAMDAGATFGVVPKVLWQKKCQVDAHNYLPLTSNVLLVKWDSGALLIDSGLGNKLTENDYLTTQGFLEALDENLQKKLN